ncbi:hypothetical protein ACNKHX_07895 [Shigella flexneri]
MRRGNHKVMIRGTFANIRIRNEMVRRGRGDDTSFTGQRGSLYL